jgi:uncharacterized membrane protein
MDETNISQQKFENALNPTPVEHDFKADHLFTYILPPITGFITLYVEKNNTEARFSAYQSILLGVLFFGAYIILSVFLPRFLEYYILTGLKFIFFGFWLFCVWMAYKGDHFELPYIGKLAHKLNQQTV